MTELFDISESLSPKEEWQKSEGVAVYQVGSRWRATHLKTVRSIVEDDEEQAIWSLCSMVKQLNHWKEEGLKKGDSNE